MATITLEEAQAHLAEIIERLMPGEEVVLTRADKPVATIKAAPQAPPETPRLGTLKGTILNIAPDFDAIPEGFGENCSNQDYSTPLAWHPGKVAK